MIPLRITAQESIEKDGIVPCLSLYKGQELQLSAFSLPALKKSTQPRQNGQDKAEEKPAGTLRSPENSVVQSREELQELIDTACMYAVRQEEQFVLMNIKSVFASYKEENKALEEQKATWIKVSAAEGAVIMAGLTALVIALSRKKSS